MPGTASARPIPRRPNRAGPQAFAETKAQRFTSTPTKTPSEARFFLAESDVLGAF